MASLRVGATPPPRCVASGQADARDAGLRWVTDATPGIGRLRCGRGFRYRSADGSSVDAETLRRIRHLAIPPAWRRVWICPRADGHIQATGSDARGRKQYRYHDEWRRQRDANKFERLIAFARGLPALRTRLRADLARPGLDRRKVLATIVRLLETTAIRIGNEEYTRANGSFGLTTLRDRHVIVKPNGMCFRFRGKGGRMHEVDVADRTLARIVRSCQELPGQELFQYLDADGTIRQVGSGDVNDYLREATGADVSAKDFRTWAGTVHAARLLAGAPMPTTATDRKRAIVDTVAAVAHELRNTPAVCRKCYIHPLVFEAFQSGVTLALVPSNGRGTGWRDVERAVVRLLAGGAASDRRQKRADRSADRKVA
jgi:DNA topoisomerase-1